MIAKRCQYGQRRNRLRSIESVRGLLGYTDDPTHRNHQGVQLAGLQFWRTTEATFTDELFVLSERYRKLPKGRGQPWKGEICEHVVYAPPPGVEFTPMERAKVAEEILKRLCPRSLAAFCWHVGDDGRDDLHIVAANFTDAFPFGLRVTDLRKQGRGSDYLSLMREFGEEAIAEINRARALRGIALIPRMQEVRARKRRDDGHSTPAEVVFAAVGYVRGQGSVCDALRAKGWTVHESDGAKIVLTPPGKKKRYSLLWEVLRTQLSELRDAAIGKHLDRGDGGVDLPPRQPTP